MGKELRENITKVVVRNKMAADKYILKIKKCLSGRFTKKLQDKVSRWESQGQKVN